MKTACFLVALTFCFSCLALAGDTFDYKDNFGRHDSALNGSKISAGGDVAWAATDFLAITGGNKVIPTQSRLFVASLPLPPIDKPITVEAEVTPINNPDSEYRGWMAVGLGGLDPGNTWKKGVFLYASVQGKFALVANASEQTYTTIKGGEIAGFREGDSVKLVLTFDSGKKLVNASINGKEVIKNLVLPATQVPTIQTGGFSGFALKANASSVKDFRISNR